MGFYTFYVSTINKVKYLILYYIIFLIELSKFEIIATSLLKLKHAFLSLQEEYFDNNNTHLCRFRNVAVGEVSCGCIALYISHRYTPGQASMRCQSRSPRADVTFRRIPAQCRCPQCNHTPRPKGRPKVASPLSRHSRKMPKIYVLSEKHPGLKQVAFARFSAPERLTFTPS